MRKASQEARLFGSAEHYLLGDRVNPSILLNYTFMLRVCQQALHNSLIHAQPQIIHINVNDDKVAFTIEDDGRGFVLLPIEKLAAAYHFGLYIMTVRLQQLGDR